MTFRPNPRRYAFRFLIFILIASAAEAIISIFLSNFNFVSWLLISISMALGGAIPTTLFYFFFTVMTKDTEIIGPTNGMNNLIIPIVEIDFEKSQKKSASENVFGSYSIISKTGKKIVLQKLMFTQLQYQDIMQFLETKQLYKENSL